MHDHSLTDPTLSGRSPGGARSSARLGRVLVARHLAAEKVSAVARARETAGTAPARAGFGLVSSLQTSEKRQDGQIVVDQRDARIRRMRTSVKATARVVDEVMMLSRAGMRPWLLTMTYRPGVEWAPRHLSTCLDFLRKWAGRRGFDLAYVWVAELQVRGAVHYHLVAWVPRGVSVPKPDKQGWWLHGMTQTVRARKPVGYLLKYASKGDVGAFPRGLRLSGGGGLTAAARGVRSWLCLPVWLHGRVGGVFQLLARAVGGGWVSLDTGEVFRSPWRYVGVEREGRYGPWRTILEWRGFDA